MAKYNIKEKKEKPATYRTSIKPEVIDNIYEQILRKMVIDKKYRDPQYTAKQLAQEIQTNTRYISAAVSLRFQKNYAELVNGYRMREAVSMLTNKRCRHLNMEEISSACGFNNRQSFYAHFYRLFGTTPKTYRDEFFAKLKPAKNKTGEKES
ncbi:MAG: helix-turn-helix domain-containing protein [Bacteroidales bacterium]|nr:helix-turn-helix domain-containing protein [Bacteroidales bacterium]